MKEPAEQEEREAERLVRQAPKQKPPRRDKRRERVQVEDSDVDTDPDLKSKDMSLNYKGVTSSDERIKAINSRGDVVYVTEETLKERPGEYKPAKDEDLKKPEEKAPSNGDSEDSKPKGENPLKPPGDKPKAPQPEDTSARPAPPKRPPASRAEMHQAAVLLADHLPAKLAAKFIARGTHPDDVKEIIKTYKSEMGRPIKNGSDVEKSLSTGGAIFQTDPDKVEPPESWVKDGATVPFKSLSPEEQSLAYSQHQMRVVALTLATQDKLQTHFEMRDSKGKIRVPKDVAEAMASSAMADASASHGISAKKKKLADLQATAEKEGYSHEALNEANSHLDELSSQDNDLTAKLKAAEPKTPEHEALKKELSALREQKKTLAKKAKDMEKHLSATDDLTSEVSEAQSSLEARQTDVADKMFDQLLASARPTYSIPTSERNAMLASLQSTPGAARAMEAYLATNDYRNAKRKFSTRLSERAGSGDILSTLLEARSTFEPFQNGPNQGMAHFESAVLDNLKVLSPVKYEAVKKGLDAQDAKAYKAAQKAYLAAQKAWEAMPSDTRGEPPKPPKQPLSYGLDEPGEDMASVAQLTVKNARRVEVSSYSPDTVMAYTSKQALYHGVDPQLSRQRRDPVDMQGSSEHISDSAFAVILASAREWLKKPALQLTTPAQAPYEALDLALATSPYASVSPQVYAKLLEALVGTKKLALDMNRAKLEAAVYKKFPNDSKSRSGGKLEVMLTGDAASKLHQESYTIVKLSDLTDQQLNLLAGVMKVKTAASSIGLEKIEINIEGIVTPDFIKELTSTPFSYRDQDNLICDEGFITFLQQEGSQLVLEIPKGSLPFALQVIETISRHKASLKVASATSNQFRGKLPSVNQVPENTMLKLSSAQISQVNEALTRLDKMAAAIQKNASKWGMPFNEAKALIQGIDKTADSLESMAFGTDSLQRRQAELAVTDPRLASYVKEQVGAKAYAKAAKVIQRDSDESYMDTFNSPSKVVEGDSDESYMAAFNDDQTVGVVDGEEESGEDLVSY